MTYRQLQSSTICVAVFGILLLIGCSKPSEQPKTAEEKAPATTVQPAEPPKPAPSEAPKPAPSQAPATFKVRFDTSKGPFEVEVQLTLRSDHAQLYLMLVAAGVDVCRGDSRLLNPEPIDIVFEPQTRREKRRQA